MGLGRFGGGIGVTRYLVDQGADVLVTDLLPPEALHQSLSQIKDLPIELRLGGHNVSDFTTCDMIVVNPAVDARDNRFLRAAAAAGVPTTTEIRLLIEALPNHDHAIAVTGSAGKSTTTAMIGHILNNHLTHGQAYIGGNLGGSLLGQLNQINAQDWVVLELSSFMLEALVDLRWSPRVAVVTNLSPNHLDRHGTMANYAAAKQVLLDHQGPEDTAILSPSCQPWLHPRAGLIHYIAPPSLPPGFSPEAHLELSSGHRPSPPPDNPKQDTIRLLIPGRHNQHNAAMALRAACCAGIPLAAATDALDGFTGLPHRLQLVADHHGVRYYNDSKATTPVAAQLAITSFAADRAGHIQVILGGADKGSDLMEMARCAARYCRGVYTIGATGDAIADAAQSAANPGCRVHRCGTLDRAAEAACRHADKGDVVLLSPGCASWDQFENYEQRGHTFAKIVRGCHDNKT